MSRPVGSATIPLWEMCEQGFGSFVALVPPPLSIGTLRLADRRSVKGFLCEAYAACGAEEITKYGGWRAWLDRKAVAQAEPLRLPG